MIRRMFQHPIAPDKPINIVDDAIELNKINGIRAGKTIDQPTTRVPVVNCKIITGMAPIK